LQQRAAASAAGASIVFTGFVSRPALNSLYERAAVFALPSRGEGFGLVYLEAMAHRLPCVGSIHDAAPEVIVDRVTGQLVDQDNIADIADTLVRLLLDESRRRAMGEAGYQRVTREFSFDRFSGRLRELIQGRSITPAIADN
jgi:phosphatidylinositol alpha-1,6-mannosyltransferase